MINASLAGVVSEAQKHPEIDLLITDINMPVMDGLDLIAYDPHSDALGTYKKTDGRRLDWILVSRDLQFVEYRVLPDKLSDHLAVFAEVRVRPAEAMGE